ncbi:MAG: hypothetical protein COV91_05730 [Candidatus Taylorbacteria bacterium CG11_big_fil_rev_8_21_14_0_20_46_11]|uniref:Lnb N-terminal periplasmic domain-containing protein n=1 Tax=Candidatus Taylorbacteria bacterium CG11_big_fil_rev_8_21_14_0_20_46_11 TaxID=1975025 RepID=A0A2H0KA53_9BACT|nr:MAG: hypothetical protein COV91_05730 [Candidatus Taylorbacteria bacterium CG11_big_fil_rev_8_21_14_0_20_46_11]
MDISLFTLFVVGLVLGMGWKVPSLFQRRPSNEGDWALDQGVLPYVDIEGDRAVVHNIRHFSYRSRDDFTPQYYDATFDIGKIERMYFCIEPFSRFRGVAHTLLSFEFSDGNCIALSVEVRKKKGEVFSAFQSGVLGLFRRYQLMYVLADERDVLKLRTNYRKDTVYMYPLRSTKEKMQNAFRSVLIRTNSLYTTPEFYHTITSNCATNLAEHASVATGRIPWNWTLLFPREADKDLFDRGFIDTELPFPKIREAYRINEKAERYANDPEFSRRIRGN